MGLLFGDVRAEDSAPVDLDRRVDDFRAINSITLRQLIGSHLENGRNFFPALFDRPAAASQISSPSPAPGSEGLVFESPRARAIDYKALTPISTTCRK